MRRVLYAIEFSLQRFGMEYRGIISFFFCFFFQDHCHVDSRAPIIPTVPALSRKQVKGPFIPLVFLSCDLRARARHGNPSVAARGEDPQRGPQEAETAPQNQSLAMYPDWKFK